MSHSTRRPVRGLALAATVTIAIVLLALVAPSGGAAAATAAARPNIRYLDVSFNQVDVTTDIIYGSAVNDQGVTVQLKLDLYRPAGDTATNRPAVVLVHGGGFIRGDKSEYSGQSLAQRGYVAVSINYRLASTKPREPGAPPSPYFISTLINAQHDAQAAVRWLRANAGTYGIDTNHIGIIGGSAGAAISLAVAYNSTDVGTSGNPGYPSNVQAVVAVSGSIGTTLQSPGDPPALFLQGLSDKLALPSEAKTSCDAATAVHLWCTLVNFPGIGHTVGKYEPLLTQSFEVSFFYSHLAGPEPVAAPFPDSVSFLSRQYRDLLLRDADPAGLVYWASQLDHATISPAQLVATFAASPELQNSVGAVTRSYLAYLNRPPDPSGLDFWVSQIRAGRTISSVNAALASSSEFQQRQSALSDQQFVDDLYTTVLARTPDPRGEAFWIGRLNAGTTRGNVVAAFAAEPESIRATAPDVAVSIGTVGLLGRTPTTQERTYWVAQMRAGHPATDFYAHVLASAEYLARITP